MLVATRIAVVAGACWLSFAPAFAQAVAYTIDPKKSEVLFSYSMPISTGTGRFTSVTGISNINDADQTQTTVDALIDTRTLRAGDYQAQLRGADFFDVGRYPQMRFKSRSVRAKSATSADITGDITVKGVTRTIVLHSALTPPGPGGARQFRAKTRINRNDFNMTAYAFLVGEAVDIEIRAELTPAR
ncbi:YceI family protein [Hyphomicrobium album]|nr:YceI family protein [Hyphomicrobium album]